VERYERFLKPKKRKRNVVGLNFWWNSFLDFLIF
jgi:hypothetical protein